MARRLVVMNCSICGQSTYEGARFCHGCGAPLVPGCPGCGAELPSAARFCPACGHPVSVERPGALASAPAPPSGSTPPTATLASTSAPRAPSGEALPASFAGERYQVRRFLGEGGRKRVYHAYDTSLDREVALAVIKTEGLDEAGLVRVRREAQAMGRLGDHPHIVTVHDIGDEEGQPFIVSQYMSGGSVEDRLAETPDHRLPVAEAVRIADEICQALEHAHARGIIHRDLKPANVWLTGAGTAKLGDFGLAVATDRSRLTIEGMVVGTVAYMAPEQALGREVDARTDLYALGALLYETLTGRPPFLGDDAVAVISQQINTPPMAPWWHNPDIPRGLGALIMELLAKTPEERPPSASDIRHRLDQVRNAPPEVATPGTPGAAVRLRPSRLRERSRFVGRTAELTVLKAGIEAALSGRGSLVMVAGEAGIGKTRLTEEAGIHARLRGAQVLVGHCYETESGLPYVPFVEAIRQHVATRSSDALREELGDGASDVAKLVSEIRQRLPDLPAGARHDPEEERFHLFESVSSFLVNASRAGPLMLVLEDLHWSDVPSLRLLQHLARRLVGSRLLVVGTYRDVELGRKHPLSEVLAELHWEHLYERISLAGLSEAEVVALLEAMADGALDPRAREMAVVLHRETAGNPFFIEEIVRHLLEIGRLYWEGGRWVIDPAAAREVTIPEGVRDIIVRRLSRLSEACNDALARAAVLGRQFEFPVLARMAGPDEDALLSAVEEALAAQLISQVKERGQPAYAFTHALVRQALYDELSLPRKQRFHLGAGEAIEAVHERNLAPHVPALALHYRLAGAAAELDKAVEYSVRAGKAAQAVFAYEETVEHWEAALERLEEEAGDAKLRAQLLERLGDLKFTTGLDYQGSIEALERALSLYEELGQAERAAQMHSRLGRDLATFPATMDVPRALSHYRAAEAILAESPESSGLGYVYLGLAATAIWGLRTEDGLAASEHALGVAERLGNERLAQNAAPVHAIHLSASGLLAQAFGQLEQAWEKANRADHLMAAFSASWIAAGVSVELGHPQESERWCRRELASPRVTQAPQPRRLLLDYLALAHARAGQLDQAGRARDEAGSTKHTAPYLALCEGDWDEAARLWTGQQKDDARRGNRRDEWLSVYWLGVLDSRTDQTESAATRLEHCLTVALEGGHVPFELLARAELALLLAETARPREASAHVARCREVLAGGQEWWGVAGRVALAEAATLAAEGRFKEADESFQAAVDIFRRYTLPWDEAETLHRWGRARREAGNQSGALEQLGRALEAYRSGGAGTRWIERVLADKLDAQGVDRNSVGASIQAVAAAVAEEQPDLLLHAAPDGTVTILFSDIEGSTAATERLGDQRWLEVLRAHNSLVRRQVAAHGGFEVKSQGDGFMVAFSSARRAVLCAIAIQRAFAAYAAQHEGEPVRVRMGIHTGEAIKEADDFFGKNVVLAARIAGAAAGGQILVSSLLKELTDSAGDLEFGPPRRLELKGLTGTWQVHEVVW